jgi:transposase
VRTQDARQTSQIFARHEVEIDRSTLANWVGGWSRCTATPRCALFGSSKLFADDTPIPVLDPGRGRTKTGRLWVYARDDRPKTFQISERADHLR